MLEPLIRIELGLTLNERGMIYLNVISVLFSVLAMVVSMCQMRQAESKKKAQIATQLLHTERSRYALEKEAVDAINIRCHDIKHQIAALGDVGRERGTDGRIISAPTNGLRGASISHFILSFFSGL